METVTSADGTTIAYERSGEGPPVVIVSGGLGERSTFAELAETLSEDFTVFNYDRRGRGDSGDGDWREYTADLEVQDLAAVLDVAARTTGETPAVFAECTGCMLGISAAAQGLPMSRLVLFEPPYSARGARPEVPVDYVDRLKQYISEGRNADAVILFQREGVGLDEEFIAQAQVHPMWPSILKLAPTLIYDGIIVGDCSMPLDELARVDVPTLVMDGGESPEWLGIAGEVTAESIPGAQHIRVPGESHLFDQRVVAPYAAKFLSAGV